MHIRILAEALDRQKNCLRCSCSKTLCLFPSVSRAVEPYSAEIFLWILLVEQPDMGEWEVTSSATALSFPLAAHVNLCDLD